MKKLVPILAILSADPVFTRSGRRHTFDSVTEGCIYIPASEENLLINLSDSSITIECLRAWEREVADLITVRDHHVTYLTETRGGTHEQGISCKHWREGPTRELLFQGSDLTDRYWHATRLLIGRMNRPLTVRVNTNHDLICLLALYALLQQPLGSNYPLVRLGPVSAFGHQYQAVITSLLGSLAINHSYHQEYISHFVTQNREQLLMIREHSFMTACSVSNAYVFHSAALKRLMHQHNPDAIRRQLAHQARAVIAECEPYTQAYDPNPPRHILDTVRRWLASTPEWTPTPIGIPPAELKALHLVAQGLKLSEVATDQQLTVYAVKKQLKRITQRLGARNRIEAVYLATWLGLLP